MIRGRVARSLRARGPQAWPAASGDGTQAETAVFSVVSAWHATFSGMPPEPPSERLRTPVDENLEQLILRCLEKDPAQRPTHAGELELEIEKIMATGPVWSQSEARTWWQSSTEEGAAIISSAGPTVPSGSGQSMAIDFEGR